MSNFLCEVRRFTIITAVLFLAVLVAGVGVVAVSPTAAAAPNDDSGKSTDSGGERTAQKNEIMQLVLKEPSDLSTEQRRKVVSWLLTPDNLDKLSTSERDAVRDWLSAADAQGVNIPSRSAVERALENAESSGSTGGNQQQKDYDKTCEADFSPALCVTNEEWDGSTVTLTIKADYPHQVVLTDGGAMLTNSDGEPIPQKRVTLSSGYTRVTMEVVNPEDKRPTVTVAGGDALLPFYGPSGGQPLLPQNGSDKLALVVGLLIPVVGTVGLQKYRQRKKRQSVRKVEKAK